MKFSKIAAIMKKTKTAILMTDEDGVQWLSSGAAIYRLDGMPTLDEDTVLTVLGVADDAKDKWCTATFRGEGGLLADYTADEEEITAEDADISVIYNGHLLTPIYTMNGMLWLDTTLLAPTEKKDMDYRKFFVRRTGKGRCIAVKEGMVLTAVIMELDMWKDSGLSDRLKNMAYCCQAEERRRLAEMEEEHDD